MKTREERARIAKEFIFKEYIGEEAAFIEFVLGQYIEHGVEELDPDNLLLWRRNPKRLDASAIRDNLLVVSGWLDSTPYGPGSLDQNHPRSVLLFSQNS